MSHLGNLQGRITYRFAQSHWLQMKQSTALKIWQLFIDFDTFVENKLSTDIKLV